MIDSKVLANCIYDIKPTSFANIKLALKYFHEQRFDIVNSQFIHSHRNTKLRHGNTLWERIFRYMMLNCLPLSVIIKQTIKDPAYRPQANFLPKAPQRGHGIVAS
ncbi:MAG: hypothetical protein J3R72DRAFT_498111 [Linnemannia gamsii]|nr:MAG: hypothetical protein J3R72DRAFT_498111 [Linnemannia gamsii]